ncbi:sigma 54-interacting transcriptional regulator [Thermithiobacillus plumbiphilus]|uniref:sigma 54-interacting transcriptional regulator n=1 Tax=Thermithiobacillus plumbiphilus TaxID=1729899 RepID=UPI003BFA04F4
MACFQPMIIRGETTIMHVAREADRKMCCTGARVPVTGPTGAGKELFAQTAHQLSGTAPGPRGDWHQPQGTVGKDAEIQPDRTGEG